MKRFLLTIALTGLFSIQGLAGQIPTGGEPLPPPPDEITQTTDTTSQGQIPTGGFADQISDATLSGLLAVLGSLFV